MSISPSVGSKLSFSKKKDLSRFFPLSKSKSLFFLFPTCVLDNSPPSWEDRLQSLGKGCKSRYIRKEVHLTPRSHILRILEEGELYRQPVFPTNLLNTYRKSTFLKYRFLALKASIPCVLYVCSAIEAPSLPGSKKTG